VHPQDSNALNMIGIVGGKPYRLQDYGRAMNQKWQGRCFMKWLTNCLNPSLSEMSGFSLAWLTQTGHAQLVSRPLITDH
jgi:hypothetical protein